MNDQVRRLLLSLPFILAGCASSGAAGTFDSHHDFHVNGVAPEWFTKPWQFTR